MAAKIKGLQYNSLPAKGQLCFVAGKLSAGLVESDGNLLPGLKPGFHSNAIGCVRCVNENRKKCKQPIMVATASTEHSHWLALAFVA